MGHSFVMLSTKFKMLFDQNSYIKYLILPILFWALNANAQKFEWVNIFGGQNAQWPVSMAVDSSGNQYATFNFAKQIQFDTFTLNDSTSRPKGLILKQNSNGKVLWHKTIFSLNSGRSFSIMGSLFNKKGNLIVFAASTNDILVGSDTLKRIGTSNFAVFMIEFDQSGKILKGSTIIVGKITTLSNVSNLIVSDIYDNFYLNLVYSGPVKVYDSSTTTTMGSKSTGSRSINFKFSNSGKKFEWSNSLPYYRLIVNSISADINGNVYAVGYLTPKSSIYFGGKTITNPQYDIGIVFIWDKNGNEKHWFWVKASGKNSSFTNIAAYDTNTVFLSGSYVGDSALFGNTWIKNRKFGCYNFISKYNSTGKAIWVKPEDTSHSNGFNARNYNSSMANFQDSFFYVSIYLRNHYYQDVIFDGQKYPAKPNGYGINLKVDARGNILWGFRSYYPFSSMGTDVANNLYFQGAWVGDTLKMGSFKAYPDGYDCFIGKTFDYAIYRGKVNSGPFCAGDSISVPYTIQGEFGDTNTFFAEISDEFGNFTGKERELGRLKTKNAGTIKGVLPLFQVASSGKYRIRIRSNSPQAQSFYLEDTLRLLIYSKDKADPGPPEFVCIGDTIQLSTYGGTKWTWSPNYNMSDSTQRQPLIWPTNDTTFKIIIADSSGCGAPDTAYKEIFMRKALKATFAFSDTAVCDTSLLKIPIKFEGGDSTSYHWEWYSIQSSGSWKKESSDSFALQDTLALIPKIDLNNSQKLALVLDDQCTKKKDTAYVIIHLSKPSLMQSKFKDTLLCMGNKLILVAKPVYTPDKNHQWKWVDLTNNQTLSNLDSINIPVLKTFQIQLTFSNGCTSDTNTFMVNVNPPLKANILLEKFNLNDTTLCFGDSIRLKSIGMGGEGFGYMYQWKLNGDLFSTADSFNVLSDTIYPVKGRKKSLTLSLMDQCGSFPDSVSKIITVIESPKADFSFGSGCDRTATDFVFTGTKSKSPITTSFHWDFEGEGTSNLQNPSKLLTQLGSRNISLTTTSSNGCADKISKQVQVKAQAKADFKMTDVCEIDSAYFVNQSSVSKGNLNFIWSFGDGGSSMLSSPTHLYPNGRNPKTYTVKLVADITNGCPDSTSKTITVFESPKADFKVGMLCSRTPADFMFTGHKPIAPINTVINWNFNNEANSNLENPRILFKNAGKKSIVLKLTSSNGCKDSIKKEVDLKAQS
ncbi:MAG: hypothetical protein ACI83I_001832, partial [Bacteroidia bacterium]